MTPTPLVDRYGRTADDLRISLIDKCNLRCHYCMPAEGLSWMPAGNLLTAAEAIRIADIGVRHFGVRDLRFTGGEPLVRRDLEEVIAGVRRLHPDLPIAITTNGIGLAARMSSLADAGLSRINISLDTVRRECFAELTRRDRLEEVIAGVDAALASGVRPVKINAVLLRGVNEDQAVELLDWCLERGAELRFIEQMPLDADRTWARENLVTAAEIRGMISEHYELVARPRGSAPAALWEVRRDGQMLGTVGIIASVTESFCAACTRTRVTADGAVRSCLFSQEETSLLEPMRAGASDEEIAELWAAAMWAKPRAYGADTVMLGDPEYVRPARSMSEIGG